jgi:hypothetical protein
MISFPKKRLLYNAASERNDSPLTSPARNMWKVLRSTILIIIVVFLLAGCAPWSSHGVTAYQDREYRIAVLPVRSDIEITSLKGIESIPETSQPVPNEQGRIKERMQEVTADITRYLETRLNKGPYFDVMPHERVAEALQAEGAAQEKSSLNSRQIQDLGKALSIQAVLTVRLSGYGRLKKRWVAYLIGTGVIEGVVEGVIAGGALRNQWIGLAVAAEEIGQEILTWGGGSYLFNMYYAPVTLEGELISTDDGKQVWSDTAFDSIDRKALKKLPEEEQKKKEVQLRVTAEKAEKDLADSLEKAAKKNLGKLSPETVEPSVNRTMLRRSSTRS